MQQGEQGKNWGAAVRQQLGKQPCVTTRTSNAPGTHDKKWPRGSRLPNPPTCVYPVRKGPLIMQHSSSCPMSSGLFHT